MTNNHIPRVDDDRKPDPQQIIRELTRAKVLFQQRAVAAVLGIPVRETKGNIYD